MNNTTDIQVCTETNRQAREALIAKGYVFSVTFGDAGELRPMPMYFSRDIEGARRAYAAHRGSGNMVSVCKWNDVLNNSEIYVGWVK